MMRIAVFVAASIGILCFIASAQTGDTPRDATAALERKMHGDWKGGACLGDWTFKGDGTFEMRHYTPGNITLTGTWTVRWNALPPTLATTCKASDDAEFVGQKWEVKILELDDNTLVYAHPDKTTNRLERTKNEKTN